MVLLPASFFSWVFPAPMSGLLLAGVGRLVTTTHPADGSSIIRQEPGPPGYSEDHKTLLCDDTAD